MNKEINKINSNLKELETLRNKTDYKYLCDLKFDEWVLILCNESNMFLNQIKNCYEYLKDNETPIYKNIALIQYTLLEADFKGIYGLYNIFTNLYEDMILNTDDKTVDLFNEFLVAFNSGIEYYIECNRLIETVKNNPNAIIKEGAWEVSEDIVKMERGDKMNNTNNIKEKERVNLHIDKKYNDLLSEYSKNNNRFTKSNINKSDLVEVALARFFAPLNKNFNLNAEPLELIRDTHTETTIQELQISTRIIKMERGNRISNEIMDKYTTMKKRTADAKLMQFNLTFKNENITKTYKYDLSYDQNSTDNEVYINSSNQGIFELLCLVSNIADNEELIKCKFEDLKALRRLKVYCLISKKINSNGKLIKRVYPLALSNKWSDYFE